MKVLTLFLFLITIASCGFSGKSNQKGQAKKPATIKVITSAYNYFNIRLVSYHGDEYLESKGDLIAIFNEKSAGASKVNNIELTVRPDQEFRFSLKAANLHHETAKVLKSYICINHAGFKPEEGRYYIINHSIVGGECSVKLSVVDDGDIVSKSINNYKTCVDPLLIGRAYKDQHCTEEFNFRD